MKQMPVEGKKFREIDNTWRDIMAATTKDPDALTVFKMPQLLDKLLASNTLLDDIQKGLNDYLETKRLAFSRFFFLSNDELLSILSETRDPTRVCPHLKKCFEGVHDLKFTSSMDITHMVSGEEETVQFSNKINPNSCNGAVEM
jgi:dynein heavy chain